jgi:hypothetical protein
MAVNPSFAKRKKERERQEKQKAKEERRRLRREGKEPRSNADGEDPDIAGIVPGPQPPPEDF